MMEKLRYSIIVATNRKELSIKRFLKSCSDSGLLKRKDLEIIITENGIKTKEIEISCKRFNVKYFYTSNKGRSVGLNLGIQNSQGEYLVFTDDDVEIIDPKWLDKLNKPFIENENIAYVSGNVLAKEVLSPAQKIWEKKGGLSKGSEPKHFTKKFLNSFLDEPWPLTKIFAGANSMVHCATIEKIGGFSLVFNHGKDFLSHGDSLEFGYRLIKEGGEAFYNPLAVVKHNHPLKMRELCKKIFYYGLGDTAVHMYLFLKYNDYRSLRWTFGGHQLYIVNNLIKSLRGDYGFPPYIVLISLIGSSLGGLLFVLKVLISGGRILKYDENIFFNKE